jgi:hypothetical protein
VESSQAGLRPDHTDQRHALHRVLRVSSFKFGAWDRVANLHGKGVRAQREFITRDVEGKATVYLLTDADHGAINDGVLSYVSEPVELAGRLKRNGDLLVYAIDPSKIVRR